MVSPGSMKPARQAYIPGAKIGLRPMTQQLPLITSMIATGSVRGKCWVLHAAQSRR
jgi:hypothetical protein